MALLTIDRERLAGAATRDTGRQLVRYIRDTLAPVLPRLPAQPELIAPFVRQAGRQAIQNGFGEDGLYSFHILTDLILGPGWEHHPMYAGKFEKYLDAPGMDQNARIALAMKAVVVARRDFEAVLPGMLDAAVAALSIVPDALKPEDIWNAFQNVAQMRGVAARKILPLFEQYEAGFRQANELPAIYRRPLTGYVELGYKARGIALPKPSDAIIGLTPHQLTQFNASLLLALIYGPWFPKNPFLAELLRVIDDPSQQSVHQREITRFLLAHRRALTESGDE
ncbi:hypothetical protein [Achromobacter arsenitoxydans]|uniref:Uncharacterized protein n=1 Tax=Achromobacter arsenitoxydans SY8 TaxID=477184 RepID=H0FC13_9BURK|nr:hypothetical protein [Achromobacter arsenitoxydans]EHK64145.1 hypothetical protein KYC_21611 [Achromobacter arsenitoxydans SY8]